MACEAAPAGRVPPGWIRGMQGGRGGLSMRAQAHALARAGEKAPLSQLSAANMQHLLACARTLTHMQMHAEMRAPACERNLKRAHLNNTHNANKQNMQVRPHKHSPSARPSTGLPGWKLCAPRSSRPQQCMPLRWNLQPAQHQQPAGRPTLAHPRPQQHA